MLKKFGSQFQFYNFVTNKLNKNKTKKYVWMGSNNRNYLMDDFRIKRKLITKKTIMGKMKQLYEEKQSINQLNNNKMSRKANKTETKETVTETREDALRRLFKENGLVKEDVYKDKRGFVIITRSGIDKIVSKKGITVAYEPVVMDLDKTHVVLKAVATMKINKTEVRNMMSFGEASEANLMGGGKKFPVAMAEKRAMSRVVLKIAGFYEQGNVFGQDEIVD